MNPKPLKVYVPIPRSPGYNASFYYRLDCPFMSMEESGLPVETIVDFSDPEIPLQNRLQAFYYSDVAVFYQPTGAAVLEETRRMQAFGMVNIDGEWVAPPSIVVNTDDNLMMVHPKNPAFRDLGIRMPDGQLFGPQAEVGEMHENGARKVIWRGLDQVPGTDGRSYRDMGFKAGANVPDGSILIDVPANVAKLSIYRDILNSCDSVICSTPRVRDYVNLEATPRRTFVSPNMVRFDHYEQVSLAPHPNEVRVLWQGSTSHFEDFQPLTQVLPTILRQYPNVKFIFWGSPMPWIMENIPTNRYEFIPWCRYEEYRLRLVMIGHDIAIAPLRPHRFNQCRSAIKFYESTVMKEPAAFLGQRSGPYLDEVQDEQTGLLYDTPHQFGEQLRRLIEDAALRKTLGANARQWVHENRDAMKLVKPLYEHLVYLREEKRRELSGPNEDWRDGIDTLKAQLNSELGEDRPVQDVVTVQS